MTPERAAALVARWVGLYPRGLPAPVAERRVDEIDAGLHDHIAHARARGRDRRIALGILSRMARGVTADASWRRRARPSRRDPIRLVLAALTAGIGVAAVVLGGADDSPGLQGLGVLVIAGAVALVVRTASRNG